MIDFSGKFKMLDGKEQGSIAEQVSNLLLMQSEGNAIKLYDIALTIYRDKKIKLDDSDKKMLKETIENSKGLTVLAKAQILKCFN